MFRPQENKDTFFTYLLGNAKICMVRYMNFSSTIIDLIRYTITVLGKYQNTRWSNSKSINILFIIGALQPLILD